jgi:DNA-binding NarL/FixJ family response regulator
MLSNLGCAEVRIGNLLCKHGFTEREISEKLGYSTRHVRRVVSNIKVAFNAKNLAQLGGFWVIISVNDDYEKNQSSYKKNNRL